MNTQINDSGVRFKIFYLASRKQWWLLDFEPISGQESLVELNHLFVNRTNERTRVIAKRSWPLFHGKNYGSDSEGDGPDISKDFFMEVWKVKSQWIKRYNQEKRIYLAKAWGSECDEALRLKA